MPETKQYEWKDLYKFLFTKYVDGNVKEKRPVPAGYKYVTPKGITAWLQ